MNAVATRQETAVTNGVLDKPVQMREAWRLLQADFSDKKDITADRWRLLAVAFESVPDDLLTNAVLNYLAKEPPVFFPRISDIAEIIRQLKQPTAFELFCGHIRKMGYKLVSDENGTAIFSNGIQEATVKH